MEITVVEQSYEGMVNSDYPARVYEGHLTEEEIRRLAMCFGGVGSGGYAGYALAKLPDCWVVNYANEGNIEEAEANKDQDTGLYDELHQGKLALYIRHTWTRLTLGRTASPCQNRT